MKKENKLSTNWLNKSFKIIRLNDKNALIEDSDGNQYLRNKVHLRKYYFDNDISKQLINNSQEEDIELPFVLADTKTPEIVTSANTDIRNEIDFQRTEPKRSNIPIRKHYPLRNKQPPKPTLITKNSGIIKTFEVTDL